MIEFLTSLYSKLSYSALNTARSALSSFLILPDGCTVGNHPLVSRFMKGVFQLKPPLPRYQKIWDAQVVLKFLRQMSPAQKLSLKDLSMKTCMLLALVSAQRQQTLHKLDVKDMDIKTNAINFRVNTLLKNSRPGNVGVTVTVRAYPPDRRLCAYKYLVEYLKRTKMCRKGETKLFVSYKKPFKKVSRDTIARWLKSIMSQAGIDVTEFRPHSVRTAAVSKASVAQVPINEILSHAGWKGEQTFQKFYRKPVVREGKFADAVLEM